MTDMMWCDNCERAYPADDCGWDEMYDGEEEWVWRTCPKCESRMDDAEKCDICQRWQVEYHVNYIGDTAVCNTCREEYTG